MEHPLQITFRGLAHSDAIAEYIRKRAEKLDAFYERITSCRVAFESLHHHQHAGRSYRVRIDVRVPGSEVVVSHYAGGVANEDAYAAIDLAFAHVQRKLHDHVRLRRGDVKRHDYGLS